MGIVFYFVHSGSTRAHGVSSETSVVLTWTHFVYVNSHYPTWFFHSDCCDVMSEFSHIHLDGSNLSCFQQVRVWPDQLAYFEDREAELQPEASCDKHRKLPPACKPQMLQRRQFSHNFFLIYRTAIHVMCPPPPIGSFILFLTGSTKEMLLAHF